MSFGDLLEQQPFSRESLMVGIAAAVASASAALFMRPQLALLSAAVIFGWTQISSG